MGKKIILKMLVCDVNNTIAKVGMPPTPKTVALLRRLEAKGVILALASGRSVEYLKGFARASGIHPLFIADNGSMIHDFEQLSYYRMEKRLAGKGVTALKRELKKRYKKGVMFVNQESSHLIEHKYTREGAEAIMRHAKRIAKEMGLDVRIGISGNGAVYISSKRINKGLAIERIQKIYHIKKQELAAMGNDANDRPVIKKVGLFVGIGNQIEWGSKVASFDTVEQGLAHINKIC